MYNSTNETRCEICGQIDVNCDGHDQTPTTDVAPWDQEAGPGEREAANQEDPGTISIEEEARRYSEEPEGGYTREDGHMSTTYGPMDPRGFQSSHITVYHRATDIDGNLGQAKINWAAIGSVSVEEARAFHAALGKAIEEAEALNAQGGN